MFKYLKKNTAIFNKSYTHILTFFIEAKQHDKH